MEQLAFTEHERLTAWLVVRCADPWRLSGEQILDVIDVLQTIADAAQRERREVTQDQVALPSIKSDGTDANPGATILSPDQATGATTPGAQSIQLPSIPDPGPDVIQQPSTPDPEMEP